MKKTILSTALLILTMAGMCFAADVTGHWTGKIDDQYDVVYDFKVDGEKLTGSFLSPDGNSVAITDGEIKGDDLTFSMDVMGNPTKFKGKVKDDVLTLTFSFQDNPMSVDLKKTPLPAAAPAPAEAPKQ